jgi:hypothetical protein
MFCVDCATAQLPWCEKTTARHSLFDVIGAFATLGTANRVGGGSCCSWRWADSGCCCGDWLWRRFQAWGGGASILAVAPEMIEI